MTPGRPGPYYFGALTIDGVPVEIIGGVQRPVPGGWGDPIDPAHHRRFVAWHHRAVPVIALEWEADAYQQLGRTQRADDIRDHLARRSHNPDQNPRVDRRAR